MNEEMKSKLKIPAGHNLVQTGWESKKSKGRDIDYWTFEETDENGTVVAHYSVTEDMNIYTQKTDFSFTRSEAKSA
ncbi:hypothetical protein [Rhizobium leguminosarum]|uniref:Uncharacterized protein n=1 Tax=Rhizobium leguminosarum TaxID=384 RepID=A0A7K3VRE4_RHILE|nr:hypothetical protein [Rhizobium leguminosarum]NEK19759.1 hypothetical protein [Rhizobium leguminosarum]